MPDDFVAAGQRAAEHLRRVGAWLDATEALEAHGRWHIPSRLNLKAERAALSNVLPLATRIADVIDKQLWRSQLTDRAQERTTTILASGDAPSKMEAALLRVLDDVELAVALTVVEHLAYSAKGQVADQIRAGSHERTAFTFEMVGRMSDFILHELRLELPRRAFPSSGAQWLKQALEQRAESWTPKTRLPSEREIAGFALSTLRLASVKRLQAIQRKLHQKPHR